MLNKIKELTSEINAFTAETLEQVEQFRIKHLSKKGTIALLFEDFKNVSVEQKKEIGKALNELKTAALNKINTLKEQLCDSDKGKSGLDLTLPGDPMHLGTRHPLAIVRNEILSIFDKLGFTISEGPEIEDDWHNFSALNFPEEHPARDMQDTFFIEKHPDIVLHTHTFCTGQRYGDPCVTHSAGNTGKSFPKRGHFCPGSLYFSPDRSSLY